MIKGPTKILKKNSQKVKIKKLMKNLQKQKRNCTQQLMFNTKKNMTAFQKLLKETKLFPKTMIRNQKRTYRMIHSNCNQENEELLAQRNSDDQDF